jgi:hypothetical protein
MSSPSAVLLDVQAPRFRVRPERASSAGPEAVELAASAGLILDPWQEAWLDDALSETADGRWAAFEAALIVPRQNGKGSVLEALELAGLFLFDEQLILHSAHEFKTAQEAFRRVLTLIQSTPDLDRLVQRVRTSHGEEGVELRSGQRLRFVARSTGSGRGFSGDRVILDEAYNLSGDAMAALLPTLSARPNPQLIYTSSAPLDRDESAVLRRLCKRGRAQARGEAPTSMTYTEFCADRDDDDTSTRRPGGRRTPGARTGSAWSTSPRSATPSTSTGSAGSASGSGTTATTPASRCCRRRSGRPALAPEAGDRRGPVVRVGRRQDRGGRRSPLRAVERRSGPGGGRGGRQPAGHRLGRGPERCAARRWGGELSIAKGSPAAALIPDLVAGGVPV